MKEIRNCIPFLDLKVKLIDGKLETDLYMKPADCHQYLHSYPLIPNTLSALLFIVKLYASIAYAL